MERQLSQRADRIGGGLLMGIGLLSIGEAVRLYPLRMSAIAGDHSAVAFLGGLLILLGCCLFFSARYRESFEVEFPPAGLRRRMLLCYGLMVGYALAMPPLGYLLSTLIGAVLLFWWIGQMRWYWALLGGVVTTAILHVVFVIWLHMSFPAGWLG